MQHSAPQPAAPSSGDEQTISCLRCEYDLSGATASWSEQCPLTGTCPECGYVFNWRDIFNISGQWGGEIGWYAEHAHSLIALILRTPGTLLRLFIPSWFFSRVHFRWRTRPATLLLWTLLLMIPLWVLTSVTAGIAASEEVSWSIYSWDMPNDTYQWAAFFRDIFTSLLWPFATAEYNNGYAIQFGSDSLYNAPTITYGLIPFIVSTIFWGSILFIVPIARKRILQRPKLLARGIILSLLPMLLLIPPTRNLVAYDVLNGWHSDAWIIHSMLILWVLALFWQQCIWTGFIHWGLGVRPSWFINLPGFFLSLGIGFYAMIRFII